MTADAEAPTLTANMSTWMTRDQLFAAADAIQPGDWARASYFFGISVVTIEGPVRAIMRERSSLYAFREGRGENRQPALVFGGIGRAYNETLIWLEKIPAPGSADA